jgi:hypothetical protein
MDKKIENILNLYENILSSKEIIFEADIKGIDELVYNPATKEGGSIGFGYDNGERKDNITWSGHDNHLHIGFTDKDVAMKIIDKADSMGLRTTENPYAKKDPNKKVDNVHTGGSLHYKNFPGQPLVGKAVDISGDPKKITELIQWINKTYAGLSVTTNDSTDDEESNDTNSGGFFSSMAQNIANTILPGGKEINVLSSLGITENVKKIKRLL